MQAILVSPYYRDSSRKRRKELDHCLAQNIANTRINHIYLVVDTPDIFIKNPKVSVINISERQTYKHLFDVANTVNPDGLKIIGNADIYYSQEDVNKMLNADLTNSCWALSRWDENKGSPELYNHLDSQDTWVFTGLIKGISANYRLGVPGCDNKIAYEIHKAGYNIYNPAKSVKTIHVHDTQKRNYTRQDAIMPPYKVLPLCELNEGKIKRVLHVTLNMEPGAQQGLVNMLKSFGEYKEFPWRKEMDTYGVDGLRTRLIEESRRYNPDFTFMQIQTPDIVNPGTCMELKGFVMNWTGDVREPVPVWYKNVGGAIDVSCFSNSSDVDQLIDEAIHSEYLQIGFTQDVFNPVGKNEQVPEIVFMGNHYEDRFPLTEFRYSMSHLLRTVYGDRFGLYGFGWDIDAINLNGKEQEEALVYRNCKIAINCSHFDLKRYSSDRLLRIMGTGAFCLTKWYPEIERDYTDGVHLRIFKDKNELLGLINYYLSHSEERDTIAKAGQRYAATTQTWDNRKSEIERIYQYSYPKQIKYFASTEGEKRSAEEEKHKAKLRFKAINLRIENAQKDDQHKYKWGILIPTIEARSFKYMGLHGKLMGQIVKLGLQKDVVIIPFVDNGENSIGFKRNALMDSACNCEYVSYFDDDDKPHAQYIGLIWERIKGNPDCVTFNGQVTVDGENPEPYNYGIRYKDYEHTKDVGYTRPPGHLTPIKYYIVSQFRFEELPIEHDRGSDVTYSKAIVDSKLIKTSEHVHETLYHYERLTIKNDGTDK